MDGMRGFETCSHLPTQYSAKINVFRFKPWGIGIRDVGRQHFHPARFELQGVSVNTKSVRPTCLLTMSRDYLRLISRKLCQKQYVSVFIAFYQFSRLLDPEVSDNEAAKACRWLSPAY